MKIKYVCQCVYCGTALGVGTDAYGKKSGLTGKWQFLCSHCFNNPDLPFIQEAAPPPKPTGESKEADENLAALFEATKAAIGIVEPSVALPDGVTLADVESLVMTAMAALDDDAELDSSTPTTDEPVVESEAKEEAEPEIDINNPPARLRSMKEIVAYAKYKIKWKAV